MGKVCRLILAELQVGTGTLLERAELNSTARSTQAATDRFFTIIII
jgi:hypothetical protein